MKIVVGLGNPGKKFEKTRHNIGSRVINELGSLNLKNVVLVKPTTFMNKSGKAVLKITKNYKLKTENLFVIHDDIDLHLGQIKIVKNRGSGGHKGVQSIIDELKTKNFIRFRIGIKPKSYTLNPKNLNKFVLEKFTKSEEKIVKQVIKKTAEAVEFAANQGVEKAMNKYN